jgi:hypothetical protein
MTTKKKGPVVCSYEARISKAYHSKCLNLLVARMPHQGKDSGTYKLQSWRQTRHDCLGFAALNGGEGK